MAVDNKDAREGLTYTQPLFDVMESVPGLDIGVTTIERLLTWASTNSLWVFPMATSCCGIELMSVQAGRVDMERMGSFMRGAPRQCDVMVVAGTITVKMAPRVKKLWDQMPEPKWVIAMGSCAISGDFYRDIYSVVPGIDTFLPVDVYVPGCPPNPEHLIGGLIRLQEKIRLQREGKWVEPEARPETAKMIRPANRRLQDADRDPALLQAQMDAVLRMGVNGREDRANEVGLIPGDRIVAAESLGIGRNVVAAANPAVGPRSEPPVAPAEQPSAPLKQEVTP
jgi:NADH-quinone oxidoreductase subunit B